ncbi:MAG: helix-turn-helix transcriptional regulator [Polyangiaceae bacterium]
MKTIRMVRALVGVSTSSLAKRAHVSVRELQRIERRESWPRPATLARIDDELVRERALEVGHA